jgi:hypothetical protein
MAALTLGPGRSSKIRLPRSSASVVSSGRAARRRSCRSFAGRITRRFAPCTIAFIASSNESLAMSMSPRDSAAIASAPPPVSSNVGSMSVSSATRSKAI